MNNHKVEDHIKTEYVEVTVTHKLRKDLQLNEEICGDCNGVGVEVNHAIYGLTVDGRKVGGSGFPFDKESIVWCRSCYNGVRKRCEFCNELVSRGRIYCECKESLESRGKAQWQKDLESWNKSEKITYTEALDKFEMVYVDSWDKYIKPDELEEYFEYWLDDNYDDEFLMKTKKEVALGLRIYGTYETHATFDADSILEDATGDLHDDASNQSYYIKDELQSALDVIAEKIKNDTLTYMLDYEFGIQLTEDDIKEWNCLK